MLIILLFLSYVTLVFFNIRCVSYRMVMTASVLVLSLHITYEMAYDDSTWLHCHNYYINLDVFWTYIFHYIGVHGYFMYLRRAVSYYCGWICLSTISPFHIFILCLYVILDNFLNGIDLFHIYNNSCSLTKHYGVVIFNYYKDYEKNIFE